MLDKAFNLRAYIAVSLVLHLSRLWFVLLFCDLLGERERANTSSLAVFSTGSTDTLVITQSVPELRRSSQGGPNKQTSLAPLFIEVGALPKQLNLSP